jgi:histidinol-phosphate aminotransferase
MHPNARIPLQARLVCINDSYLISAMPSELSSTTYEDLARPDALNQPIYEPGRPIDDVARDLGLDPATIIKLASNENPLGPSPLAVEAGCRAMEAVRLYPEGGSCELRCRLAERFELGSNQIIVGNGSNEIIELLGHVFLNPGDEVVMGTPAFIVYKLVTLLFGAHPVEVGLVNHRHDLRRMTDAVTDRTKLIFLPSPNNPTGTANSQDEIEAFVKSLPETVVFVIDEAYAEYLDRPPDLRPLIAAGHKAVCMRTFSKIYGLAGLRVGYGYGSVELIALLNRVRQPFNINVLAQATAVAALDDRGHVEHCRLSNQKGLVQISEGVKRLGLEFIPSVANFLTVRVGDGRGFFQALQKVGVIVRPMEGYGMTNWIRVTVGTAEDNERLLAELEKLTKSAGQRDDPVIKSSHLS